VAPLALVAFGKIPLFAVMRIPEDWVGIAVSRGWVVVAKDSDFRVPSIEANLQSNPRRAEE
jgi:hypothetical protein